MQSINKLLLENKVWAAEKKADDPEYFATLAAISFAPLTRNMIGVRLQQLFGKPVFPVGPPGRY